MPPDEPELGPGAPPPEPEAATAPEQEAEVTPAPPPTIPWEDAEIGRLRGLVRTLGQLLCHPRNFFQNLPREGWGEALAFGLIVRTAGLLACLYWQLVFYLQLGRHLGELSALARQFVNLGAGIIITVMLLAPSIMLLNLAVSSLGLWAAVLLSGGPQGQFPAIWRLTCYAQGALVAGFLPVLGGPVAGFGTLVLTYQGLRGVLGFTSGRALGTLCLSLGLQVLLSLLLLGSLTRFWFFSG